MFHSKKSIQKTIKMLPFEGNLKSTIEPFFIQFSWTSFISEDILFDNMPAKWVIQYKLLLHRIIGFFHKERQTYDWDPALYALTANG